MTDRAKVILGLEYCAQVADDTCDECPYDEGFGGPGCAQLAKDALELLKEQEPVAPTVDEDLEDKNLFKCVCGGSLGMKGIFRYCPWCGRKVLWDETD